MLPKPFSSGSFKNSNLSQIYFKTTNYSEPLGKKGDQERNYVLIINYNTVIGSCASKDARDCICARLSLKMESLETP